MADLSDVSAALAAIITAAVYPGGAGSASAIGAPCKVCEGWPIEAALDADLRGLILSGTPPKLVANGIGPVVTISIYPQPNMERVTTRYSRDWQDNAVSAPTITASVAGLVVTLGGTITAGNYVAVKVNGALYSYATLAADTLASVAAALAALIAPNTPASAVGQAITLTPIVGGLISVATGAPVNIIREIRRQQRSYQITIWAPSNALRVATAELLDPLLAGIDFITMASDLSQAWLVYRTSNDTDNYEKTALYRRDLCYWVEYATTQISTAYPVAGFQVQVESDMPPAPDVSPVPFVTITPTVTTES